MPLFYRLFKPNIFISTCDISLELKEQEVFYRLMLHPLNSFAVLVVVFLA